jgi:hypothetical protein
MNMAERQIVTFGDLDRDTRQKIADLLDHSSAAKLKFSSKSMMAEMSNHLNCVSLPATYISVEPRSDYALFDMTCKSLIEWYRVINGINQSQRNPCIKIENKREDYNGAGTTCKTLIEWDRPYVPSRPCPDTVHIKYDPDQTYIVQVNCNHANDEKTMDDIEPTILNYYNVYYRDVHMDGSFADGSYANMYFHKTRPGITLTTTRNGYDGTMYSKFEIEYSRKYNYPPPRHPESFKRVIETVVGALTELQNSIDTLQETEVEMRIKIKDKYLPLYIPSGEIGTVYMPLL